MYTTIRTNQLIGPALDWAVAKCEGFSYERHEQNRTKWASGSYRPQHWQASTNWQQGGPIIERRKIQLLPSITDCEQPWRASNPFNDYVLCQFGPTPLIAAMRCYVASVIGDTVQIPRALVV